MSKLTWLSAIGKADSHRKGVLMKKTLKLIGIIATVALIGFSMAACDQANDPAPAPAPPPGPTGPVLDATLNGTWVWGTERLTLNNGQWNIWIDGFPQRRGTYTTNSVTPGSGTMVMTVTEIHNGQMWLNQSAAISGGTAATVFMPENWTYLVVNNETLHLSGWGEFFRQ